MYFGLSKVREKERDRNGRYRLDACRIRICRGKLGFGSSRSFSYLYGRLEFQFSEPFLERGFGWFKKFLRSRRYFQ